MTQAEPEVRLPDSPFNPRFSVNELEEPVGLVRDATLALSELVQSRNDPALEYVVYMLADHARDLNDFIYAGHLPVEH